MAKKQKFEVVSVRGESINGARAGALRGKLDGSVEALDLILEAYFKQWVLRNNADWMRELFRESPALVGKNGKLKKLGREAAAYLARYTFLSVTEGEDGVSVNQTKNKKNKGSIKTDEIVDGRPVSVELTEDMDLPVTFSEYQERQAGESAPAAKNKKATTVASQLESIIALARGEKDGVELLGDPDALRALVSTARELADAVDLLAAIRQAELASEVDADAAARTDSVAPQASKRADTDRVAHAEQA